MKFMFSELVTEAIVYLGKTIALIIPFLLCDLPQVYYCLNTHFLETNISSIYFVKQWLDICKNPEEFISVEGEVDIKWTYSLLPT